MRSGDIGQTILFHLRDHRPARFRDDSFVPIFLGKPIAEIVMFVHGHVYVANWGVALFKTDRIGIPAGLGIDRRVSFLVKLLGFVHGFHWIPGQKPIDFFILKNQEQRIHVLLCEFS